MGVMNGSLQQYFKTIKIIFFKRLKWNQQLARMAEWSKAVDLRPTIVRCEGSNPSSCIK